MTWGCFLPTGLGLRNVIKVVFLQLLEYNFQTRNIIRLLEKKCWNEGGMFKLKAAVEQLEWDLWQWVQLIFGAWETGRWGKQVCDFTVSRRVAGLAYSIIYTHFWLNSYSQGERRHLTPARADKQIFFFFRAGFIHEYCLMLCNWSDLHRIGRVE